MTTLKPSTTPSTLDVQRSRFMRELRRAGWRRPISANPVYTHPDGGTICIDCFRDGQTIWRRFYEAEAMPETSGTYT